MPRIKVDLPSTLFGQVPQEVSELFILNNHSAIYHHLTKIRTDYDRCAFIFLKREFSTNIDFPLVVRKLYFV